MAEGGGDGWGYRIQPFGAAAGGCEVFLGGGRAVEPPPQVVTHEILPQLVYSLAQQNRPLGSASGEAPGNNGTDPEKLAQFFHGSPAIVGSIAL